MIKTKFVFAVSLVAMLAVSSAWAYDPADTSITTDTVATEHTVYENQTPTSGTGIAGVSYVNKAVNVAGASAQAAEAHAAAAGQSALNAASSAAAAADSAQLANNTLANKQDKLTAGTNITIAQDGTISAKVDTALSSTSTNPVQNKVINEALSNKLDKTANAVSATKATQDAEGNTITATYEKVANKYKTTTTTTITDSNKDTLYPSIGKVQSMINDLDVTDSVQAGKYVSAVSETDGKIHVTRAALPTIPTVNNAMLTIQKNGTNVATFTANSGTAATANITVPTTVAELSDHDDYATKAQVDSLGNTQSGLVNDVNELTTSVDDLTKGKQEKSTAAYQMGNASGSWTAMTTAQQNALNSGVTSTTKVTHTANTAAGTTTRPVYVTSGGVATAVTGMSIPYGKESNPTSWATIWVE